MRASTPSPAREPGGHVDGGYFQVLDYLNRLEAMDRIVVVDTLSLAPSGAEDGDR
jgi:hypothetical protein